MFLASYAVNSLKKRVSLTFTIKATSPKTASSHAE